MVSEEENEEEAKNWNSAIEENVEKSAFYVYSHWTQIVYMWNKEAHSRRKQKVKQDRQMRAFTKFSLVTSSIWSFKERLQLLVWCCRAPSPNHAKVLLSQSQRVAIESIHLIFLHIECFQAIKIQ